MKMINRILPFLVSCLIAVTNGQPIQAEYLVEDQEGATYLPYHPLCGVDHTGKTLAAQTGETFDRIVALGGRCATEAANLAGIYRAIDFQCRVGGRSVSSSLLEMLDEAKLARERCETAASPIAPVPDVELSAMPSNVLCQIESDGKTFAAGSAELFDRLGNLGCTQAGSLAGIYRAIDFQCRLGGTVSPSLWEMLTEATLQVEQCKVATSTKERVVHQDQSVD